MKTQVKADKNGKVTYEVKTLSRYCTESFLVKVLARKVLNCAPDGSKLKKWWRQEKSSVMGVAFFITEGFFSTAR